MLPVRAKWQHYLARISAPQNRCTALTLLYGNILKYRILEHSKGALGAVDQMFAFHATVNPDVKPRSTVS